MATMLFQIVQELMQKRLTIDAAIQRLDGYDDLLRWFSADCVQHTLQREAKQGRSPHTKSWQAVSLMRQLLLGEDVQQQLRAVGRILKETTYHDCFGESDDPAEAVRETAWLSALEASRALTWGHAIRDIATTVSQESAKQATWSGAADIRDAKERKQALLLGKQAEFQWQRYRLAYLCEVWAACGHRALSLLAHKDCPMHPPPEALLDFLEFTA